MDLCLRSCMVEAGVKSETVKRLLEEELDTPELLAKIDDDMLKSMGLKVGQIARIRCAIEACMNKPNKQHKAFHADISEDETASLSDFDSSMTVQPPSPAESPAVPSAPCKPAFSKVPEKEGKKDWLISFQLPDKFSKDLSNALKEEKLPSNLRNELNRDVCNAVRQYTLNPSGSECAEVCRMLIRRYPFLADKMGPSSISSWVKGMTYRFKTMRRKKVERTPANVAAKKDEHQCKKRKMTAAIPEVDGETEETCEEHVKKMKKEMMKTSNRNTSLLKELMSITYDYRRRKVLTATTICVEDIVAEFPALQLVSELKREIERTLERPAGVKQMTDSLRAVLVKILKMPVAKKFLVDSADVLEGNPEKREQIEEGAAVVALPFLLKEKSQDSAVIKLCTVNESIDKAIEESVCPRLVGGGDLSDIDPLYIAAEGRIVAKLSGTSVSLPMALVLLMGTYYVFNIEYPQKAKNVYLLLEASLLNNTKEAKNRVVLQKFLAELD